MCKSVRSGSPKGLEKPKNLYFYGIFCYSYGWILMKIFK